MFHINRDYNYFRKYCVYIWIGGIIRAKSAPFSAKSKETEALILQVSQHEYLLPVLFEKYVIF